MTRTKLRSFRALLACEIRQLWRSFLPWPLVLAVPALIVLVGRWQAPALRRVLQLELLYLALFGMGLGALAAWTWQRGRRNGSDEILLAWPVPSWQVGLARTLALGSLTLVCWLEAALPSLAYTAVSYTTAAQAGGVALPVTQALRDGGLIVLSLAASFLAAQALGQLAGALLPGLPALVLLVLYRAAVLFAPRVAVEVLQWPYGLLATPEFLWDGTSLTVGLQTNLYTGLFTAHQGFWVLGSLAFLALAILLFRARRDGLQLRAWLLAGPALLVTVAAALPFLAIEHGIVASQWRAVVEYGEAAKPALRLSDAPEAREPAAGAPIAVPLSYELAVDLTRPPLALVQAAVELQAPASAPLDVVTLTLRRAFEIDSVSLDGASAPFEREGDILRIHPPVPVAPGQSVTVMLAYHGRVADWRLDPYETPAALAGTDLVFLPASWGWYPVPGEQRLTWEIGMSSMVFRALADRTQPFNDAEPRFDVTVQAPPSITDLTGFSQASDGSWRLAAVRNRVNLLGGPWWKREQDGVEYAVLFEELDTWQAGSADLQRLLAVAQNWTGIRPLAVVPSPVNLTTMNDAGLLDEGHFDGLIEPGAGRDRALLALQQWMRNTMRLQIRLLPEDFSVWTDAGYTGYELAALQDLTWDGIVSEAYGSESAVADLPSAGGTPLSALADAWAARTPPAAQKEALRRIFQIAQLRPLVPADLAFLREGGQP